jgi:hypothetical protein
VHRKFCSVVPYRDDKHDCELHSLLFFVRIYISGAFLLGQSEHYSLGTSSERSANDGATAYGNDQRAAGSANAGSKRKYDDARAGTSASRVERTAAAASGSGERSS